jgi:hypothetical protein
MVGLPPNRHRVSKLSLSLRAATFASRRAYCLAYRFQRESPRDRAGCRAFRLRRKLGSTGAIGDLIERPKGMRWKTFDRHMKRIARAEGPSGATWLCSSTGSHGKPAPRNRLITSGRAC